MFIELQIKLSAQWISQEEDSSQKMISSHQSSSHVCFQLRPSSLMTSLNSLNKNLFSLKEVSASINSRSCSSPSFSLSMRAKNLKKKDKPRKTNKYC